MLWAIFTEKSLVPLLPCTVLLLTFLTKSCTSCVMDWKLMPRITFSSFHISIALKCLAGSQKVCPLPSFDTICNILQNTEQSHAILGAPVSYGGGVSKGQLIVIVAGQRSVFFLRLLLTMFAKRWVILKVLREPVSRIERAEQRSNDCAPSECSCQWGIKGPPVTTWTTHCHHSTLFGTCLVRLLPFAPNQPTNQKVQQMKLYEKKIIFSTGLLIRLCHSKPWLA